MKTVTVGRKQGYCDIVINDEYVSGCHLRLTLDNSQRVLLEDMQSTNGTFVNGNQVSNAYLEYNDIVRIGNTVIPWRQYLGLQHGYSIVEQVSVQPTPKPDQKNNNPEKLNSTAKAKPIASIWGFILSGTSLIAYVIVLFIAIATYGVGSGLLVFPILMGLVGIVLSIVGISQKRKHRSAIVFSILGLSFGAVTAVLIALVFAGLMNSL